MELNMQLSKLSNGLRVCTSHMPHVDSVAIGVWVGVGGRFESARMSGASHFIEHLLFKGTKNRSAKAISQAIEGRGGYFNAFTQEESTCYYARVSSQHTKHIHEILCDMYRHPLFAAADINKERGVIIEELMMYRDQPQHYVQDMLGELLWSGHPLGRPLIGTSENILRMTKSDILRYKNSHYLPSNTVIVFAGNVDHEKCVAMVERSLGSARTKRAPTCSPVTQKTRQRDVTAFSKDIEQSHLALGFRLFGRNDRNKYALKLMSVMLGENMSSRLFQVVRERHGLAYSVHSSAQLFADTGVFDIQAGVDRKRTRKALRLILREIAKMKEKPVGAMELKRAKDYAIGQLKIGLESTISQMMWAGENQVSYGRFVQPDEVVQKLQRVQPEDIQRLARQRLTRGNVSAALIRPGGEEASLDLLRTELEALRS